jgi:hypothetical protein
MKPEDKAKVQQAIKAFWVATTPLAKDRQEVLAAITALRQLLEQPTPVQEPCGWQFYQDGKWHNGMDTNDHRANTEAAGFPVRDVYPEPQPVQSAERGEPVSLLKLYDTIIHWDEGGGKRSRRELALRIAGLYTTPPTQPAPVQDDPDEQVIRERDEAEAIADALAEKIAAITGCEIGEHASANSPWHNALDAADEFLARRPPAPAQPAVPLTDEVVQKIISNLEPLLNAKNQSWADAEKMLHGITATPEKGGAA